MGGVLIAIDQMANVVFLNGFPDETISSRLGRRIKRTKGKALESKVVCAVLDKLDRDHCATSIEENPDGSTDAHHLGRVIHELPPDPLRKVRSAGFVILAAFLTMGASCERYVDDYCRRNPQDCNLPPSPVTPNPDPSPQVSPLPSPLPPVASPVPSPSPETPSVPTPKPPKPCKVNEADLPCWTCSARLAYDERNKHIKWDAGLKLYFNDPPGKPREYFDRACNKTDAQGRVLRTGYEWFGKYPEHGQGLCPPEMLTCPSPSPAVTPKPSPVPLPSGPPVYTESGNLPVPYLRAKCARGFSPTHEVGISVLSQRECSGEPGCRVVNLHATEKSAKPYCEHSCYDEEGRYSLSNCRFLCETLRECQQPEFVTSNTGIKLDISHPDWNSQWGDCDKRTADCSLPDCRRNFICHDRVVNRSGPTMARACMPDGTRCGPVKSY